MKEVEENMQDMWSGISSNYGNADDLEQKQRQKLAIFLEWKKWSLLELACGNGKVLQEIQKQNKELSLSWMDYNVSMVQQAKKIIPRWNFWVWDITKERDVGSKNYDIVLCLNSLHNLPDTSIIYSTFETMIRTVWKWWYVVFDVRNKWNPFISHGYKTSRTQWLSFWTLNYKRVLKIFKKQGFKEIIVQWIYYRNQKESFFDSRFKILNFLYTLYLYITRYTLFSPYIFIVLQKK